MPPKPGRHWFNPSIAHIEGPELLVSSGSGPYSVRRMTLNKGVVLARGDSPGPPGERRRRDAAVARSKLGSEGWSPVRSANKPRSNCGHAIGHGTDGAASIAFHAPGCDEDGRAVIGRTVAERTAEPRGPAGEQLIRCLAQDVIGARIASAWTAARQRVRDLRRECPHLVQPR